MMACALRCPATNPTASSSATDEGAVPEAAAVLSPEVPVEVSSAPAAATPENSCTTKLIDTANLVVAVTVVADRAPAEYQISPLELWPDVS